jgi:NAD kinase
MAHQIAVYGGTFSPPGLHHRRIAQELIRHFDQVMVVPCGPRPDKPCDVEPVYRAAMADLAFRGLDGVKVELFDLEQATFTRTCELDSRYASKGDVWHVVGTDLITDGRRGQSFIHKVWHNGPELWRKLNYAVIRRPGIDYHPDDLPPRHRFVDADHAGSSFTLREKLYHGDRIDELVNPAVAEYLRRHRLYQGGAPSRETHAAMADPRLLLFFDERNEKARTWAEQFRQFERPDDPNCVLVIGGDGTMLRAIHRHWRLRVPFFGVNAGHLGFLLNNKDDVLGGKFPPSLVVSRHMPLLYVEMQKKDGTLVNGLTFNDVWVERKTGQTAWLEVNIDGRVRMPKLVCDGILMATAAGSTAYARSMGAQPLLADTPAWLLVGSNVMLPNNWKSALLSLDSRVEIRSLDTNKRPLEGYIYGEPVGEVVALSARVSRIAAVELAFCPSHDITEKISQIQFPVGPPVLPDH